MARRHAGGDGPFLSVRDDEGLFLECQPRTATEEMPKAAAASRRDIGGAGGGAHRRSAGDGDRTRMPHVQAEVSELSKRVEGEKKR